MLLGSIRDAIVAYLNINYMESLLGVEIPITVIIELGGYADGTVYGS